MFCLGIVKVSLQIVKLVLKRPYWYSLGGWRLELELEERLDVKRNA